MLKILEKIRELNIKEFLCRWSVFEKRLCKLKIDKYINNWKFLSPIVFAKCENKKIIYIERNEKKFLTNKNK